MSGLSLKALRKSYGAADVIKGVDLEIAPKEFVVFVGPSGCGKSTLLRMIAGLEDITSGELRIGDKVILEPMERPPFDVQAWRARLDALGASDFLTEGLPDDPPLLPGDPISFD